MSSLFFLMTLSLCTVNPPTDLNWKFDYCTVNEDGIFCVESNKLYFWQENEQLHIFQLPDYEVFLQAVYIKESVYARYLTKEGIAFSVFTLSGDTFKTSFEAINYLQKIGDRFYCALQLSAENIEKFPHLWLCEEITFIQQGDALIIKPTGMRFSKLNQRHVEYTYDFKSMWYAPSTNGILSMSCLDAKIYQYSPKVIKREQADGALIPTDIPFTELILDEYKRPPDKPFSYPRVMKEAEAEVYRNAWIKNTSFIHYFGAVGNGYFVAYGELRSPNNYLALLNKNFKTIKTLKIKGKVVGARDHKVYVLTPEKHLEAIPVKEL